MPNVELSSIYNSGKLGRCNSFQGTGTNHKGNRLTWALHHRRQLHGGRVLGGTPGATSYLHPYMTHRIHGTAAPANQIHAFHSPISPEGLYWVIPVPSDGLALSGDGKAAALQMTNVLIIDPPYWPATEAETTPASLDFKLLFSSTDEPQVRRPKSAVSVSISRSRLMHWKSSAILQ